ncbi:conjugative transposon protein TraM [Flavobacterium sp. 17A]|uniref:Conjugative transposon protein TraM n=1 Tax=Flavobacterium potami TaxID=2872310 RepID=A0A9X1HHA9_9FLAO|nr:conjugative transposon protein TraM [Flavobacterium potami]MBZ4037782.1 conjugative transposon protein TraM [Flavobacterium potami]
MNSLNNPENVVSNQPFFETIFTKHKKLLYALPVIVVLIIVGLYMTSGNTEEQKLSEEPTADVSLPGAKTKELSNDKLDVMSDFSELTDEKQKQQNKSEQFNVENINTNESVPAQTYQNENDKQVVEKVNKMLVEMNKEQKKQKRTSSTSTSESYSNSKYTSTKPEIDYEEKSNTESSFNNFFNSKNNSSVANNGKAPQQAEQLIYASIKGDHLRLRNNSRVTLILPKETVIDGKVFKKNTLIYAQATFNQNRVNLSINNINQVPLKIKAYDAEDGNLGLQVQRSLVAETGSEVAQDGADEIDVNGVPLGNTIKSLFKRKQQEPKIDLLNNQRLILKLGQ